jgi:uncharacterized protein (DUF1501 family)
VECGRACFELRLLTDHRLPLAAGGPPPGFLFVPMDGFDLPDFLPDQHRGLLTQVGNALKSFHNATVELGVDQQVTACTASDFGRTLTSNGDGSDHGWGSHHFLVGGALAGGRFHSCAGPVRCQAPSLGRRRRASPTAASEVSTKAALPGSGT